eukprot:321456-Amphidinium_carterae.1
MCGVTEDQEQMITKIPHSSRPHIPVEPERILSSFQKRSFYHFNAGQNRWKHNSCAFSVGFRRARMEMGRFAVAGLGQVAETSGAAAATVAGLVQAQ